MSPRIILSFFRVRSSRRWGGRWLGSRGSGPVALVLGVALSLGCSDNVGQTGATGGAGGSASGSGGAAAVAGTGGAAGSLAGAGGQGGNAGGSQAGGGGATGGGGAQGGTGGAAGGGAGGSTSAGTGGGGTGGSGGSEEKSGGCGKMRTLQDGANKVQSGGKDRSYKLRVPADYDETRPHRLIVGFHGAGGKSDDIAPSYFGLWDLAEGSTIFAAPDAIDGLWKAADDTTMVGDLLKQLEGDLCIDTSRVAIEGFSQGGAMVWTLACALPGKFNVAIVHSGGGLPLPKTCEPIPFISMLGDDGSGQDMSSDFFAMTNGCTVKSLPVAPSGGHACTDYEGCSAGYPTRWCDYDAGHTPSPTDSGQSKSWVPQEVWNFVKQF